MLFTPMKTSPSGRLAIERREGCKLRAYQDQRGVWTIGYGHTSMAGDPRVQAHLVISQKMADEILSRDLAKWEANVNRALKVQPAQCQFDAMVSLCHNIGEYGFDGSSVLRDFNEGLVMSAANAFLMWEHPKSLVERRVEERAQFLGNSHEVLVASASISVPDGVCNATDTA